MLPPWNWPKEGANKPLVRNRHILSTVRLGLEVLRRPDYKMTVQDLFAAVIELASQLLKGSYALGDL